MNKKDITEKIIIALTAGENLSTIFLKVQLLASLLGNDEFSIWLRNEQYGYTNSESIPEYRKLRGGTIKANILILNGGMWKNFDIPIDAIDDSYVRDLMATTPFAEPIAVLEGYANPSDGKSKMIQVGLPSCVFPYIDNVVDGVPHTTIHAWKLVSSQSINGIIDHIKSTLLDFIIKLNKDLDLNLDISLEEQSKIAKIVNQTIYANTVHTGTGNITSSNSNLIVGDNSSISLSPESKQQIQELVNQLSVLKKQVENDEDELAEYLIELQEELDKKISSPRILRKGLRAIKAFGGIVSEKAIELGVDRMIDMIAL